MQKRDLVLWDTFSVDIAISVQWNSLCEQLLRNSIYSSILTKMKLVPINFVPFPRQRIHRKLFFSFGTATLLPVQHL
jgi:hypothetical protein